MIDYEALTELYSNDTQIRIKDEHGESALAEKTIPTTTNDYYRVLAHNEPADDVEKPADEAKYDDSLGVDFRGYYETVTEREANNLAAAARNKNDTAFTHTRETTTQRTRRKRSLHRCKPPTSESINNVSYYVAIRRRGRRQRQSRWRKEPQRQRKRRQSRRQIEMHRT